MRITITIGLLFLTACSSKGFNRGDIRTQLGTTKPVYTDGEIHDILAKKANLPKPFRMAVYFEPPKESGYSKKTWRWTAKDKEIIFQAFKDLEDGENISKVFLLSSNLIDDDLGFQSRRIAAARQGADALMIIRGATDIDRFNNSLAYSYALVLPMFFVDGNEANGLFVASAEMWDVRNEYLYMSAEVESQNQISYPMGTPLRDNEIHEVTKGKAVSKLRDEIKSMLEGA